MVMLPIILSICVSTCFITRTYFFKTRLLRNTFYKCSFTRLSVVLSNRRPLLFVLSISPLRVLPSWCTRRDFSLKAFITHTYGDIAFKLCIGSWSMLLLTPRLQVLVVCLSGHGLSIIIHTLLSLLSLLIVIMDSIIFCESFLRILFNDSHITLRFSCEIFALLSYAIRTGTLTRKIQKRRISNHTIAHLSKGRKCIVLSKRTHTCINSCYKLIIWQLSLASQQHISCCCSFYDTLYITAIELLCLRICTFDKSRKSHAIQPEKHSLILRHSSRRI